MSDHPPATILIIDNDDGVTRAIATRLESMGYTCLTASTGAQGVELFTHQPVDLVITDLNMPCGDGIAVVESIRRVRAVPVIIVTGFRAEYRRDLGGIRGVTVLEKPFETKALVDLVETELALADPAPARHAG